MTKRAVEQVLRKAANFDLGDPATTLWLSKNLSKIQTRMQQPAFIQNSDTIPKKSLDRGSMIFFGYSPKTKSELMFWDEFPIVIYLHPKPGGFLGVNFHYLPPRKRALFLNETIRFVNDPNWHKSLNKNAKIKVTYPIMKYSALMENYEYCIKRYYLDHIVTKIARIPPEDWKTVPFFPLDRFKGASRQDIWSMVR